MGGWLLSVSGWYQMNLTYIPHQTCIHGIPGSGIHSVLWPYAGLFPFTLADIN